MKNVSIYLERAAFVQLGSHEIRVLRSDVFLARLVHS